MPREEVCKQCGIAIASDGYFVCDDCRAEHTQQKPKAIAQADLFPLKAISAPPATKGGME